MSSDVYVKAIKISSDAAFSDMAALNAALRASEAGELAWRVLEDLPYDIVTFSGGVLRFIEADTIRLDKMLPDDEMIEEGYSKRANVWACWGLEASQVLADHLTAGEIVLEFDCEWGETLYHKITPGKAASVQPSFS